MTTKPVKVLILGDHGCGKTNLMNQYVSGTTPQKYRTTIGADFMKKDATIDDRQVTLQIWDTAGQERFRSLGVVFYRGSDVGIIVFDLTVAGATSSLDTWLAEFREQVPEDIPVVIVGNKTDLPAERRVTQEEVAVWRSGHPEAFYFETSTTQGRAREYDTATAAVSRHYLALSLWRAHRTLPAPLVALACQFLPAWVEVPFSDVFTKGIAAALGAHDSD
eukprot:TRINITY_DN12586_c0_g1_i1.p3 TRINITY_DN12586_c0_g1~~TRINITY_DN12586_c0_g1_i1.p3  ORF type:complete len:220 (+),score=43.87 TRINITY_DN12586_c0_g1_i1:1396-2055(+)